MVTAIVLAAGLSKRMGNDNKMLLPYKDRTVIAATVENIFDAGIIEVIVVTGFEADKIEAALQGFPVKFVHNPDYEKGMTTSTQKGIEMANTDGYMVCLGDMIKIKPAEYLLLCKNFDEQYALDKACIVLPFYKGEKGNPVIFSKHYREAILSHADMEGCRGIVQENKQHVVKVEMPTEHVLMDLDYPEDYQQLSKS